MRSPSPVRLLVVLAALIFWPAAASAQDLTRDRVQMALDLTDRRIEQAQMLLSESPNERARTEIELAVSIQAQAKVAFNGNQLSLAMRLTLEARGHADRAIYILKGPNPDGVLAQLERTRDLLERARERIEECQHERPRAMLRVALEMQQRAETAAREGRYLAALQLTMGARQRVHRALRMCRAEETLQENAERTLQRTDEVLERAREQVQQQPTEHARQALNRAQDLQARAWTEFRASHFEASLRLTQSARTYAERAIRFSGGGAS